ncbi:flagellar protein FilC [Oleiphilus sp. HI0009]|uniref:flagellar protein FilC n=1 Tax=unclassified Oleiphilus TaxID=2631174 RepID=UPI0007C315A7|nr:MULTISPECIES: flagellar protein FilC [unclassified Oleiphilus]KZX81722.1 flagellar protein FilC [Oleiphilus sp. HI0009]KZY70404.1 flagellar protein FilC [Oleiphilus sp. HI0067]KZY71232.1 flagellar protein FilC [Oleiphilus sp. HI0066]
MAVWLRLIAASVFLTGVSLDVFAEEKSSTDRAREALAQQGDDESETAQLEEVFQAAEKRYSMLKSGGKSLSYSFSYSYTSDTRIDLEVVNNLVRNLDVNPTATHSMTNSFSFAYGILNNVTISTNIPLSTRYDTTRELSVTDFGDISLGLRWQPFAYVPGRPTITVNSSLSTKTGVSPYEINPQQRLSTGSGTYAFSTGVNVSKVLDPVVVFGSVNAGYSFEQNGLNQVRGGRVLKAVHNGQSFSFSGGFSYSLSYDTSLSISTNVSYNTATNLYFTDGTNAETQDSASGSMNMSLGIRVDPTTIINTSFGFGLTEDASDFNLGFSLPINIGAWTW